MSVISSKQGKVVIFLKVKKRKYECQCGGQPPPVTPPPPQQDSESVEPSSIHSDNTIITPKPPPKSPVQDEKIIVGVEPKPPPTPKLYHPSDDGIKEAVIAAAKKTQLTHKQRRSSQVKAARLLSSAPAKPVSSKQKKWCPLFPKPTRRRRSSFPAPKYKDNQLPRTETGRISFVYNKIYNFGASGSGFHAKGEPQDFYAIRDQCLANGTLFEDYEFPANDSSLFYSQRPDRHFEWRRPGEIVDDPKFFVSGYSRFDVQQGELGDCWLLAAVANLTLHRRLFLQVVPDDQSFDDKYAGIFHFRFWQYGRWIDVVVDDKLPTYRGELIFLRSSEENEFWSALVEKAYAKLNGSYEALKGGSTCEAMEDFTGGITEMYEMDAAPPNLFAILRKAYERSSLMACSIEPDPNVVEAHTNEGLIRGHAYSITRVKYVSVKALNTSGRIPLLRLRNPWGNENEWNGAWSDRAPEWRCISDYEKQDLGLTFDADGEFWMSFKDFQQHFTRLEICNLNPDSLEDNELTTEQNKKWASSVYEGAWVRGVTAGGCRNFLDTFWRNPQYRVTLTSVDDNDDEGQCTLIVALMQKHRRLVRSVGGDLLTIGFVIYHIANPESAPKPLDYNFFKYNSSVGRSPSFINLREISCRFKFPPGTYCIVPSTFDPNERGEFLLRIFTEQRCNMQYDGPPLSDYYSRGSDNVIDDNNGDKYHNPYPSYPQPSAPSYRKESDDESDPNPSSYPYPAPAPYPVHPNQPGPYPFPSYPYPADPSTSPYPYPAQPPTSSYPYPQPNPAGPYPAQYPGGYQDPNAYPQYPPEYPQYPPPEPPRSSRSKDPIINFFSKLFR